MKVEKLDEVTIRELTEDDADRVMQMIHRVIDISYHDAYPADAMRMYKMYHSRENIITDAGKGCCVIAEIDGEIVGTGTISEHNIRRVYIDPDYHGRKIGTRVYNALERFAIDHKIPELELGASVIAREFWERQGFTFHKEERIPTPNGQELLFFLMSKELPEIHN